MVAPAMYSPRRINCGPGAGHSSAQCSIGCTTRPPFVGLFSSSGSFPGVPSAKQSWSFWRFLSEYARKSTGFRMTHFLGSPISNHFRICQVYIISWGHLSHAPTLRLSSMLRLSIFALDLTDFSRFASNEVSLAHPYEPMRDIYRKGEKSRPKMKEHELITISCLVVNIRNRRKFSI